MKVVVIANPNTFRYCICDISNIFITLDTHSQAKLKISCTEDISEGKKKKFLKALRKIELNLLDVVE